MQENKNLTKFTFILSLGTIISVLSSFFFRIITLNILDSAEYNRYALIIQMFNVFSVVSRLQTVHIATREMRLDINNDALKFEFVLIFLFSSVSGSMLFFISTFLFFSIKTSIALLLSISMIFLTFIEYYMAVSRAYQYMLKASIIPIFSNILRLIFILFFLIIDEVRLESIFILFSLSWIVSFIFNSIILKIKSMKLYNFFTNDFYLKLERKRLLKNLKNSIVLTFPGFIPSLMSWLITFFGVLILNDDDFKIFDLGFLMVSIVIMFSSNLTISSISFSKTDKIDVKKMMKISLGIFFLSIITSIFIFLIINYTKLSNILFILVNLKPSSDRITIFSMFLINFPIITLSGFLDGKLNVLGKYKINTLLSLIALMFSIFSLILSQIFNSIFLVIFSIFIFYSVKNISIYLYLIKKYRQSIIKV